MLVAAGLTAIGTTSAGIAFANGRPDHLLCSEQARMRSDSMFNVIRAINSNVSVPVNADLEGGFGDSPEAAASTISQAIADGAVGANIKDYTGERKRPLYGRALAVERLSAACAAIDASGIPFVLVARAISIGGSLARFLNFHMRQAVAEMLTKGTFSFTNEQVPQAELNRIFASEL